MSSESDSEFIAEDDDETKIYQLIYDMYTTDDRKREEKGNAQSSYSSEHSPVHVKMNAETSLHAVVSTKGSDIDVLDNIHGMPALNVNVEPLEEKPWRKAGADISDYFNYGFDEESWNAYCKKQTRIHAVNNKLYAKMRVQKRHTRHREEELCCAYSPPGSSSIVASRESSAIDMIEGQPGPSRRVEGQQCLSDAGNNTQVVTEMSPEEDRITSYHLTPSNFSSLFAYVSPPSFLYQPGPAPLLPVATLDRNTKECDDPSTSQYPFPSGSMVPSAGVKNTAKAWEYYIWQEKCNKDTARSRDYGHDKDSKRGRDRETGSFSSSHSSGEERMRHRDTTEQGHHSFERDSVEKERHRERRRKSEEWQKSSHSSSSRRRSRKDDGQDRKSQNRHKHKKTTRNGKNKETNKMLSSDNEENQI